MTRGLQRSSLRSQLCNNDICGRCGKILSDVSACVVLGVVPCIASEKIIFNFQKNLSVQKYARLCNAIINVKDCCKRNSGLLFPSSGGFSCDVPDKEYIYEVSCDQGSANGYTHAGPFLLGRSILTWTLHTNLDIIGEPGTATRVLKYF